jgi:hypothetical protein
MGAQVLETQALVFGICAQLFKNGRIGSWESTTDA